MLPDLFRRLRPLFGKRIDRWWLAYNIWDRPEERRDIEVAMTVLAVRNQGIGLGNERIVLEPPPREVADRGDLLLGSVEYPGLTPYPVRISYNELLRHLFLLGPSGTGKTTFIIGLLRQLLRDGVAFWAVDFKRSFRSLLHDEHGASVLVLGVGRNHAPLRVNMLAPPNNVERTEWIEALADLISVAYLLMHGSRNVLKTALSASKTNLREARDHLAAELVKCRSGSRRYGWLESAHRALDELTKGALGEALCASNGTTFDELLTRTVVFELEVLGDDQRRCVCLYLLHGVLLARKQQQGAREVLRHVLLFDEAHNVFTRDRPGELGLPSRLAREVREYGEAIISATQQADVADSLIANSGTKIILRCDHPKDVDFSSRLLQVENRWITRIPMGQAIVRLPTRFFAPFLITFPEQPLKNTITTDETVRERYTQWMQVRASPASDAGGESDELAILAQRSLGGVIPVDILEALDAITTSPMRVRHSSTGTVDERMHTLIGDIAAYPISTVTQRYERLGWNPSTGNAVKDRLAHARMVSFTVLQVPNSRVKLLTLTHEGIAYAQSHGMLVKSTGRAGLEHEFWRARLKERCEARGYTATSEYHLGDGRHVDLFAAKGAQVFFIEVETGKSDVLANVRKCEGSLIVFFTSKDVWQAHQEILNAFPGVRSFSPETLSDFHSLLRG